MTQEEKFEELRVHIIDTLCEEYNVECTYEPLMKIMNKTRELFEELKEDPKDSKESVEEKCNCPQVIKGSHLSYCSKYVPEYNQKVEEEPKEINEFNWEEHYPIPEPKDPIQDNERLNVYRSGYEQGRFDEQIERLDVIQEWMVTKWEEYTSEGRYMYSFIHFIEWLKNNK